MNEANRSDPEAIDRLRWRDHLAKVPLNMTMKAIGFGLSSYGSKDGSNIYPTHAAIGARAGGAAGNTVGECIRAFALIGLIAEVRHAAKRAKPDERTASYRLILTPDHDERMCRVQEAEGTEFITAKGIIRNLKSVDTKASRSRRGVPNEVSNHQAMVTPGRALLDGAEDVEQLKVTPERDEYPRQGVQLAPPGRALNTKEHPQEHQAANTRSVPAHARGEHHDHESVAERFLSYVGDALSNVHVADNDLCQYCGSPLEEKFRRFHCTLRCVESREPGNHADRLKRGMAA